MVSSLKNKNLYRIVLSKKYEKVKNIEEIKIGYRIRDIILTKKGELVILTDTKDNNEIPKILIIKNKV